MKVLGILSSLVWLLGCAPADGPGSGAGDPGGGKADRWDPMSDPDRFGGGLDYVLRDLPLSGRAARSAWPSTYWPTYQDSFNQRWRHGDLSPAEKYDLAFNGWTPPEGFLELRPFSPGTTCGLTSSQFDRAYYEQLGPLAQWVSANLGNKRSRDGYDNDLDGNVDECNDNDGVDTWWGSCHAWTPASMLEDAPQRSVTHNDVIFHVADLQALIIAAYQRSTSDVIGARCDAGGFGIPIERDEHGRVVSAACRDSNPGAFHVIMTNFLGLQQRPYAEDRTYDYQVWNQPVVAFEVRELTEIDVPRANELLDLTGDTYAYNADAAQLYYVEAVTTYITESYPSVVPPDPARHERTDRYTYILEIDTAGEIIGGEWIGASRTSHPDFLWSPRRPTESTIPHLDIENVRMLIAMSRDTSAGVPADTHDYPGTSAEIPDADPTGATTTITVPDSFPIGSVGVSLELRHPYVGDLHITLTHAGLTQTLWNNQGGSDDDIRTTLPASGFTGDAAGEWTLTMVDGAAQDVGALESWSLSITRP